MESSHPVGDFLFKMFLFMLFMTWVLKRSLRKFDDDGMVKKAAMKGASSMISRWLK